MERSQHGLLEEFIMTPRRSDQHQTFAVISDHQYFQSTDWTSDQSTFNIHDKLQCATSNTQLTMFTSQQAAFAPCPNSNEIRPNISMYTPPIFQVHEELGPTSHDINLLTYNDIVCNFQERYGCGSSREDERDHQLLSLDLPVFSIGSFEDKRKIKSKVKKVEGQPSKNLMAERRRRKRLNDRLSMLRSVVPRISKMDRTSILGDTIDYMKELLEKINNLEIKDTEVDSNRMNVIDNISEATPKNSSRFEVKRKDKSTEIDISCPAKPGLVLSTLNTIETLGLDIQQCVISCFNEFTLQASCSEAEEHRRIINYEDLRRALSRNAAGYGGRCL